MGTFLDLNKKEVDAVIVDLPENKEKALNIALNKISGDWDIPKLKDLLMEIDTGEFDTEATGFSEAEIEDLINQYSIKNVDDLLSELDLSEAIEKPVWAVIRTSKDKIEFLENSLTELEKNNIKIERSYEI